MMRALGGLTKSAVAPNNGLIPQGRGRLPLLEPLRRTHGDRRERSGALRNRGRI